MNEIAFDGVNHGYVPPADLQISQKLKLHRDVANDIDPVTFEVIRHKLWNINEEHGATIQRISGSPVAIYALDLNPSILTEDAEFVYFGPYMQYMSGVADTQVKWILENRSDNPGIRPGDMFLANDPWVGAAHQMDVMLICPLFCGDELFGWVTNCLHQYDLGGITPGSFCPSAPTAFEEGILIPPIKIVENDEIRRDVEDLYLRSSRRPDMVALDFRAQLAGCTAARDRILALIERYGAATVKGVMKRVISNGESAFLEKLKRLPDGTWRDRTYVECAAPGDRNVYPVELQLTKKGDTLTFQNVGTADQIGGINATYSGWRGSLIVALNQLLCWEQDFAVGGALRHVKFDPTPGTLNCAAYPASVSTATTQAMEISLYPAYNVLSKMIYADPTMRRDIMCIGGTSQWPTTIFRGTDQRGQTFGYILIDPIGGAIGAFSDGDGISTGGQSRTPICKLPNVEHTEQSFPVLFLYRKELTDSGGAGKFRGGLSAETCFIAHNTPSITHDTLSSGNAVPTSTGMMGGYPGAVNAYRFNKDSDILTRHGESRMIGDMSELEGNDITLGLREENLTQGPADVYAVVWSGAGGFGDPTTRDPEAVLADVINENVSVAAARNLYGVVVDADNLTLDQDATHALRSELRQKRVAGHDQSVTHLDGPATLQVTETLAIKEASDGPHYSCVSCSASLGPVSENYKSKCVSEDTPIQRATPTAGDPKRFVDPDPVFRQFFCPGCGTLIENEVTIKGSTLLRDFEFTAEEIASHLANHGPDA